MANLETSLGSLHLQNPILPASGTFGYGLETPEYVDIEQFGGIITKSLTRNSREGNPPPRITETTSGMINSIGLANIGVEAFIDEKLPVLRDMNIVLIGNIAGSTLREYCEVLEMLEEQSGIHGYEINVSCPNVKEGGMEFGVSVPHLEKLISALRERTPKPLITKLSPNVTSIETMAKAAVNGGTDIISLVNTLVGTKIDIETYRPKISTIFGGLSGPAIKPIAVAQVFKVYRAVNVPIIGLGGIQCVEDVIEFMQAGASAVEIGTMNYRDPAIGIKIIPAINEWLDKHNFKNLHEIIGLAHE